MSGELAAGVAVGESLRGALVDKAYVIVRGDAVHHFFGISMAEPTPEDSAEAAASAAAALVAEAAELDGPAASTEARSPEAPPGDSDGGLSAGLPTHALGLLRIRVPVSVTLAAQRKSVKEIIELGPGAIIKFEKTCEEPLDLCVGERPIATGEVVKVGDKFGLKVRQLRPATPTT